MDDVPEGSSKAPSRSTTEAEEDALGDLGAPLTGMWRRGVTEPHRGFAPRRGPLFGVRQADFDAIGLDDVEPARRAISEPVPVRKTQQSLIIALDAVETALPFRPKPAPALQGVEKLRKLQTLGLNGALCLVSLVTSCLFPALVDLSRTATAFGPNGAQTMRLPYSALSVLRAEAAFNIALGVAAIALTSGGRGFRKLLRLEKHKMMLPLTVVYCLGDVASLCAIARGGGLLYVAVGNSRLLFAAGASKMLLGRRQSLRQWLILAEICAATAVYTALSGGGSSQQAGGGGLAGCLLAAAGVLLALAKAALSGLAAVLTESRYKACDKDFDLWQANTLLKAQSLAIALVAGVLCTLMEDMPLCDDGQPDSETPWCVDRQGWDHWTWAVLAMEIGAGWLSVAVLTRMSAIAKFVCKTATAPSMYLLYCAFGGLQFESPSFLAVMAIAAGILAYTVEPHFHLRTKVAGAAWVAEYGRAGQAQSGQPRC